VFDGGLRRAQVAQARAEFDFSAANYRSTVVSAFQQVEDSLATLNHYHDAVVDEKAAVDAAQRTLDFSMALYKQGRPTISPSSPRRPRSCRPSCRRSISIPCSCLPASTSSAHSAALGGFRGDGSQ